MVTTIQKVVRDNKGSLVVYDQEHCKENEDFHQGFLQ